MSMVITINNVSQLRLVLFSPPRSRSRSHNNKGHARCLLFVVCYFHFGALVRIAHSQSIVALALALALALDFEGT